MPASRRVDLKSVYPANVKAYTTPGVRGTGTWACTCAGMIYGGYYNGNEARREMFTGNTTSSASLYSLAPATI